MIERMQIVDGSSACHSHVSPPPGTKGGAKLVAVKTGYLLVIESRDGLGQKMTSSSGLRAARLQQHHIF